MEPVGRTRITQIWYSYAMSQAVYAIGAVVLVSALSLAGAITLLFSRTLLRRIISFLVALSVGALFGGAFIHLIPEAFEVVSSPLSVSVALSCGVLIFFLIEKVLRWRHSHGVDEESIETVTEHNHDKKHIGWLVFFGDGIHNIIDGAILAAAFLTSTELGIATTLAVILHELPQEMGDFGLLLHSGWSSGKALLMNFASGMLALVGALAVFLFEAALPEGVLGLIGAFAAGGFIYIAGADLVPELQEETRARFVLWQVIVVGIGFALMLALALLE